MRIFTGVCVGIVNIKIILAKELKHGIIYPSKGTKQKGNIMAKKVPAYIKEEARKLSNALKSIKKYAETIEEWVDDNTDINGFDFFLDNKLDNPYEFRGYHALLLALEEAVEE